MSGLLYKNFYVNRASFIFSLITQAVCSLVIILMLIFTGGRELNEDATRETIFIFTLVYYLGSMLPAMASGEVFRTDESRPACAFAMSSPAGAKGHVESKYYYILVVNLAILFMGFLTDVFSTAMTGGRLSLTLVLVMIFCWRLLVSAVEIPFMIRFGSEHGMQIKGAVVAFVLMLGMIYFLFGDISWMLDAEDPVKGIMDMLQSGDIVLWFGLFPIFSVAAYYLSCKLSVRIFRKGAENYEQ